MASIQNIINAPNTGLIPYLDARLNAKYKHLFIRPYNFGTASLQTGIRFTAIADELSPNGQSSTLSILIGRMIRVTNSVDSQLAAVQLSEDLRDAIAEWSTCVCPGLMQAVDRISGSIAIKQDPNISSDRADSLWAIVVRSFDIRYSD